MFPIDAFQRTLGKATEIFRQLGIRFHLTGSVAAVYYAEPRLTQDIDIVIDNTQTQATLDRFLESLEASDSLFDADQPVDQARGDLGRMLLLAELALTVEAVGGPGRNDNRCPSLIERQTTSMAGRWCARIWCERSRGESTSRFMCWNTCWASTVRRMTCWRSTRDCGWSIRLWRTISSGPTTVANLFYNMASGKIGLVGLWDAVAFDEVADLQKMPKEVVTKLKTYRESGTFACGKEASVLPGLLILGDLSIQGNIKSMRSLAEPLQIGMENGARRALIPLENKRHFLEVSGDIVERVDPIFYSDPITAAMKALGMT